jgi:hypothetical protein
MFLSPMSHEGAIQPPPEDVYLAFLGLADDPDGVVAFANRYGHFGLPRTHFHVGDSVRFGETWSDWSNEIQLFQSCFDLWEAAVAGDMKRIRHLFQTVSLEISSAVKLAEPPIRRNLVALARYAVVRQVNMRLAAGVTRHPSKACNIDGCPHQNFRPTVEPHATFTLAFSIDTTGAVQIQPKVAPSFALISSIWFQFANIVTGERRIRRCEAPDCGKWMDVTGCDRPGARRLHPECSRRWRMKRWRENSRTDL